MNLESARSPDQPLENAIAFRITRVSRVLRLQLQRFLHDAGLDISPEQYLLLYRVVDHPGQTLSDLTDAVLADHANITRQVDSLSQNGLVVRVRDPDDRRRQRVEPTEEGVKTMRGIREQLGRERRASLEGVDPKEFEVFVRVLGQIEALAAGRVGR